VTTDNVNWVCLARTVKSVPATTATTSAAYQAQLKLDPTFIVAATAMNFCYSKAASTAMLAAAAPGWTDGYGVVASYVAVPLPAATAAPATTTSSTAAATSTTSSTTPSTNTSSTAMPATTGTGAVHMTGTTFLAATLLAASFF
jgi:flagellar hook-length control protein FliK